MSSRSWGIVRPTLHAEREVKNSGYSIHYPPSTVD